MTQRRIISTLTLLVAIVALGNLACHRLGLGTGGLEQIWRSLASPQAARAGDGKPSKPASAEPAPRIMNPFITPEAEAPAAEERAADLAKPMPMPAVEASRKSAPANRRRPPVAAFTEHPQQAPALETVPLRRTNPQLADEDVAAGPAEGTLLPAMEESRPLPTEKRQRYADREQIVPVAHQDPIAPQPAAEPEPIVSEAEQTVLTTEDNPPPPVEEPVVENPAAPLPVAEPQPQTLPQPLSPTLASPTGETCQRGDGVQLQWMTPSSVSLGQEVSCQLVVRNAGDVVAQGVLVVAEFPNHVEPGAVEPPAPLSGRTVTWRLGDLSPGASVQTQLSFTPRDQGDLTPRAAVTFTRQVAATIKIVQPRLTMSIDAPREAVLGQPAPCQFRVTNEGTGVAVGVSVDMQLGEGLEAAAGSKSRYNIGTLGPGESRPVQIMISGTRQGEFAFNGRAVVGSTEMDRVSHTMRIVQPAVALEIEGPKLRFVDRRASYQLKVQNPGPAAIDNVQLLESIPAGFRFVEASSGGTFDRHARQVAWFVGRLEANETATVGVQLLAVEAGDHRLNAAAQADFGVIGEAEAVTRVKGAPRIAIEVSEDDDPVEIAGETIYRIRLSNNGSTPARGVQFAAEVPQEMQIVAINGPVTGTIKGQQLVFPAVDVIEPGQSVAYDVHVKCVAAGEVRFRAYFRSEDAPTPVLEEEATRIYAD